MTIFAFLLTIFCTAYLIALLWLRRGANIAQGLSSECLPATQIAQELPSVSVIVSARNEEARLPNLLSALVMQDYPIDKLEIILVNDRSSDGTSELMEHFAARYRHVRHHKIRDTLSGFAPKKRAIDFAIRRSRGEIILLTDADAVPAPTWVRDIAQHFAPEVVMVCGYSPYHPRNTVWQNILALEYFSLAAVSAGSIGSNRPLTCTGSNFAYRKSAYLAVNGFEGIAHWISGDDDLFLHKMHDHRLGKILYAAHPGIHAAVRPPASWSDFRAQRTRYASKGRQYKLPVTLSLAAAYVLNFLLCVGLLSLLWGSLSTFAFTALCAGVKAAFEYRFLQRASRWFGEDELLKYFPLAMLLHPFYIVYFATLGQFSKFTWRGQEFASTTVAAPEAIP